MNILFVMYDQLRFDYLSCAGHPHLETPNFDRVAAKGVRFTRAYCQSPLCGPSRMSFYTGRYTASHGAHWNGFPLRVGELTMGDHLRAAGMDCYLLGKTHMAADKNGIARLGIDPDSQIGRRQAECGFDAVLRDDGLWGQGPDGYYDAKISPYNAYLNAQGYEGENPWANHANAGVKDGQIASGWMMQNASLPANIREEDSETAWLTTQAMRFLDGVKGRWCAHISYIKPHWPYIAPAPYHNMFGANQVPPAHRHPRERDDPHPVYRGFMDGKISEAFQRDEVRQAVIPAYMGLIKQCDDHLGRLLDHLETTGKADDTIIILTSDHGDYLGDHWMGEKDLFHEPSVKIPLIIYDPRASADGTRGSTCDALVEAIDVAATSADVAGGTVPDHVLEGRSLLPWLRGETPTWRDFVISEYDYSVRPFAKDLVDDTRDARLFMVFDGRHKLIHAEGGMRPMLFDLETDPDEFLDLGGQSGHEAAFEKMYSYLAQWGRRMAQRVTRSDRELLAMRGRSIRRGILPFLYDGTEAPADLTQFYRGAAKTIVTPLPDD
ncbi:MAG: sulfatase-like hydrolase/transferase [Pseudomonadota bacterium]